MHENSGQIKLNLETQSQTTPTGEELVLPNDESMMAVQNTSTMMMMEEVAKIDAEDAKKFAP